MHIIQMAFSLLAGGASVLMVSALVIESLHDKNHSRNVSIDMHGQPADPAHAREQPADPGHSAQPPQPKPPQGELPKSIETDAAVPVSGDRDRRRKKERTIDSEERESRKRQRDAKRRERGKQPRRRRRDADSDLSPEAQEV